MKNKSIRVRLEGQKYGSWSIGEFIGLTKNRQPRYQCTCECGKEKIVTSSGKRLSSESCGCKNKGRWEKGTFAPDSDVDRFATLRGRYRRDARTRGYEFLLTNIEFDELIQGECYYCGSQKESSQMYNFRELVHYTGIDRVNNDLGYIKTNCVSCCGVCNNHKKSVTKEIIKKAYEFLFKEVDEIK